MNVKKKQLEADKSVATLAGVPSEEARELHPELFDPDDGCSGFGRAINKAVEFCGVMLLFSMTAIIFVNAVGRYGFNAPLAWAENLVIALLPWLAVCGFFLAVRRRNVIRVTMIAQNLPPAMQRAAFLATSALSVVALLYLAYFSFQYFWMFGGDIAIVAFGMRSWWFFSALFVGLLASALAFLVELIQVLRGEKPAQS